MYLYRILGILVIVVFSINKNYSQDIIIDELIVSNIFIEKKSNIFIEHQDEGPFIRVLFTIRNISNKCISIKTNPHNFLLSFKHKEKKYEEIMVLENVGNEEEINIPSNSSFSFSSSSYIFLGTNLLTKNKYDFTLDLLEVLPTLKLSYTDSLIKIKSNSINNVVLKK